MSLDLGFGALFSRACVSWLVGGGVDAGRAAARSSGLVRSSLVMVGLAQMQGTTLCTRVAAHHRLVDGGGAPKLYCSMGGCAFGICLLNG